MEREIFISDIKKRFQEAELRVHDIYGVTVHLLKLRGPRREYVAGERGNAVDLFDGEMFCGKRDYAFMIYGSHHLPVSEKRKIREMLNEIFV